jgi:hypothetical protein
MAAQAKVVGKAKGSRGAGRPKKGGVQKTPPKSDIGTLAEAGIDKNLAKRARKLASTDDERNELAARLEYRRRRERFEERERQRLRTLGGARDYREKPGIAEQVLRARHERECERKGAISRARRNADPAFQRGLLRREQMRAALAEAIRLGLVEGSVLHEATLDGHHTDRLCGDGGVHRRGSGIPEAEATGPHGGKRAACGPAAVPL